MSLFLHVVWFQCPSSSRVTDDARIPALVYRCTHALHFTSFKEPCPELIGSRDRHRAALLRADQPMVAQPLHDAELVSWAGEVVHRLESTSLPVKERVSKSALRYDVSIAWVALMSCASDSLHFTSFKEPCPELIGSRDRHNVALLRADQPTVLHDAELVSWAGEVVRRLESTSLPVKERVSKSALRYHVSIGCAALMRCASDILEVPPKTAPLSCVGPQASLPEAFGVGARLTYLMSSAGEIVVA